MLRLVVVNADDFGLHEAVNEGVVRAHREGIVTSASLASCGRAFADAVSRFRSCPELDLGVHLTLVEECPVSSVDRIPSLVDRDGKMPGSAAVFARRWLTGLIRERDVRRELEAQMERVVDSGIRPTHLDSHQHVHCLPGIWAIALDLARRYGVPYVRIPAFESIWADARTPGWVALRAGVNVLARVHRLTPMRSVRHSDDLRGCSYSGHMTTSRLLEILDSLQPGLTEVMVHPAFPSVDLRRQYWGWEGFDWGSELNALTDPRVLSRCRRGDFVVTSFAGHQGSRRL